VTVRRSIFNGMVSPPKSANGMRTIKLSKLALNTLNHHLENHAGETWVFATRNQTSINATNFYHQSWRPLLAAAGLPTRRFHDLRHTAATLMLQQNVNPKIVSNILGHGDVAFTLTTYSHVLPWMQGTAAGAMDKLLD
jgi:integrase